MRDHYMYIYGRGSDALLCFALLLCACVSGVGGTLQENEDISTYLIFTSALVSRERVLDTRLVPCFLRDTGCEALMQKFEFCFNGSGHRRESSALSERLA